MKLKFNSSQWKSALEGPLPGAEGHRQMSTAYRGEFRHGKGPADAAVMILLYPVYQGNTNLVLMKRNPYDGPHSAQVSLPGGAWEPGDTSLADTAIRETREELGLEEELEILGSLSPLHIPVSNFMVHPFVAWCKTKPVFRPDPSEVCYLIETTLEHLLDPSSVDAEIRKHHGQDFEAPFYRIGKEKVWGATAMMLAEFLQLAASLPAHQR